MTYEERRKEANATVNQFGEDWRGSFCRFGTMPTSITPAGLLVLPHFITASTTSQMHTKRSIDIDMMQCTQRAEPRPRWEALKVHDTVERPTGRTLHYRIIAASNQRRWLLASRRRRRRRRRRRSKTTYWMSTNANEKILLLYDYDYENLRRQSKSTASTTDSNEQAEHQWTVPPLLAVHMREGFLGLNAQNLIVVDITSNKNISSI